MQKKTLFDRFLFLINSILATALLLSYLLPFTSPKTIPFLAILSLAVPTLIILNILFLLYWWLKLKKYFLLPAIALAAGFGYLSSFYKFSEKQLFLNDDVKVMSYNVRMFNYYKWSEDTLLTQKTVDFISDKAPDILAFQEYYESTKINFDYPYKYIKTKSKTNKFGLAIYSKYKIIRRGSLDFKNSANNAIFIDILKNKDTIRVYNIHLESLKINPNKEYFGEESNQKLLGRLQTTFKKQASQVALFLEHEKNWNGKQIICGDFNNTSFSWVYKQIANSKKDAFVEAGSGFGKTFNFLFPVRIDFILTDSTINISNFKTFTEEFSDHYPILARLNW